MTKEDVFMRLKKYFGSALIFAAVLSLTGCGEQFPTLTDEEYNQTVEYAVGLLMKYSRNDQAKLTYVDPDIIKKERELQARALEEAQKAEELPVEPAPQNVYTGNPEDEEDVDVNMPEGEDTSSEAGDEDNAEISDPHYSNESEKDDSSKSETPRGGIEGAITLSHDQTQEILDDIFLSYQGYSVSSTYPESSKSYVVNANKGKKLLVLRFDLYNASDSPKEVNMLKLDLMFQIILNGKNIGYSSVTFLPNDLSSYIGTIDSRAHESLAVLTQIDEKNSSNVETLGMIITRDGKDQTVNLR